MTLANTWTALNAIQSVMSGALMTARLAEYNTAYSLTMLVPQTWGRGANYQLPQGAPSPAVRIYIYGHTETDLIVGGGDRVLEVGVELGMGSSDSGATADQLPGAIGLYAEAIRLAMLDDLALGRASSTLKDAGIYDVTSVSVSHDYIPGYDPSTRAAWLRAQLRIQLRQRIPTR